MQHREKANNPVCSVRSELALQSGFGSFGGEGRCLLVLCFMGDFFVGFFVLGKLGALLLA